MRTLNAFRNRSHTGLWLVLVLFVLKAMVPQGFMPATQQAGTLIQLCTAAGPVWVPGPSRVNAASAYAPGAVPGSTPDSAPDSSLDHRHAAQAASCPVGMALAAAAVPPTPMLRVAAAAIMAYPLAARAPPTPLASLLTGAPVGARAPPFSSVLR